MKMVKTGMIKTGTVIRNINCDCKNNIQMSAEWFGSLGPVINEARRNKFLFAYARYIRGLCKMSDICMEMGYTRLQSAYAMKNHYEKQMAREGLDFYTQCDYIWNQEVIKMVAMTSITPMPKRGRKKKAV